MDSHTDLAVSAALEKVGRNVAKFSTLERLIRKTVEQTQIYVTLDLAKPTKVTIHFPHPRKSSLGRLMDQLCENLFSPKDARPPDATGPTTFVLYRRLTIEMTRAEQRVWKKSILKLIAERNHLVHTSLAEVDFQSADALRELSTSLDEQNSRLSAELAKFRSLYEQLHAHLEDIHAAVQSGELVFEKSAPSTGCVT
jgi:hypothetical protein